MGILQRMSRQQDVNRDDRSLRRRLKMLAGPGIILYVFAMSFAAIDWVMSLSLALGFDDLRFSVRRGAVDFLDGA